MYAGSMLSALMSIPLVQGTLRYAYKVGIMNEGDKAKGEGAKAKGEGHEGCTSRHVLWLRASAVHLQRRQR